MSETIVKQLVPVNLGTYSILDLHNRLDVKIDRFESLYADVIDNALRKCGWTVVDQHGKRNTTDLEKRTAIALTAYGLVPPVVVQEHAIGKFHADFAIPKVKVVIEVDGIHHLIPAVAAKDVRKDQYLAKNGWDVYRIDCMQGAAGKETIGFQVAAIAESLIAHYSLDIPYKLANPDEIVRICNRHMLDRQDSRLGGIRK